MLEAIDAAIDFIADKTRATLELDRKTLFAVIRCVEIIGEAASKVSDDTRSSATDIPWAAMVGMRNRLIHAYFDIDVDVVWKTVINELPTLKTQLQALLQT